MVTRILCADALEGLKQIDSGSINTCVTSPPYYGLRDYGVEGQIGLEQTPDEYIARLVSVFREVRRVLRDDGPLWVNIGDSYAGGGRGDGSLGCKQKTNIGSLGFCPQKAPDGTKPKDLIGTPWMLAFALRADGWYLRQDIIWAKPNPMPESVTDRCTKSHEYIFLLSKSQKYYYDHEAIKEPITEFSRTKSGNAYNYQPTRNKRDVWTVPTKGFKEAHFAVYPPELIKPCILAGCPEGGIVLDPFTGSGTTGIVALENGREFIGCELNPTYAEMATRRLLRTGQQIRWSDEQEDPT